MQVWCDFRTHAQLVSCRTTGIGFCMNQTYDIRQQQKLTTVSCSVSLTQTVFISWMFSFRAKCDFLFFVPSWKAKTILLSNWFRKQTNKMTNTRTNDQQLLNNNGKKEMEKTTTTAIITTRRSMYQSSKQRWPWVNPDSENLAKDGQRAVFKRLRPQQEAFFSSQKTTRPHQETLLWHPSQRLVKGTTTDSWSGWSLTYTWLHWTNRPLLDQAISEMAFWNIPKSNAQNGFLVGETQWFSMFFLKRKP